jgi:hypothetical protein
MEIEQFTFEQSVGHLKNMKGNKNNHWIKWKWKHNLVETSHGKGSNKGSIYNNEWQH